MNTVNDAYEAYRSGPTDENYARLYEALREYSQSLAKSVIPDVGRTYHHHAAENAASNSLLELEKFDPQKASFSTWAYMSIKRDLIDWARKRERRRENSLEESLTEVESNTSKSTEAISAVEARLFLQKFLSTLSDEERTLCEMMQNERPLHRMAYALGVSLATVKRRWDGIREKGRNALVG
jgi:RNA polymerase sigma factor (sigma-70 family)